jgi:hypothetical protein
MLILMLFRTDSWTSDTFVERAFARLEEMVMGDKYAPPSSWQSFVGSQEGVSVNDTQWRFGLSKYQFQPGSSWALLRIEIAGCRI